jgi:hypothetical protein
VAIKSVQELYREVGEPKFEYFDLISGNLANISIKKSASNNCYIVGDDNKLYNGFILAKNNLNHTICILTFFQSSSNNKYIPRPEFQIVKNIDETITESNIGNDRTRRIDFKDDLHGLSNFWKMIQFLSTFKDIVDIGSFQNEFKVIRQDDLINYLKTITDKNKEFNDIANKVGIPVSDMALYNEAKERIKHLEIFKLLLEGQDSYIDKYKVNHKITAQGDEAAWHHFLKEHQWVFGINLDLRFIENFADEQHIGNSSTENRGNPTVDMTGYSDYTILIELKTSKSNIFTDSKSSKARANTWSFSEDFVEGFSQCLGQKSDWDKNELSKKFVKDNEQLDKRMIRTVDPKVIFIFGNKEREIPKNSINDDIITKRDTLERFIRNNRNIEFLSYDELYRRAEYIVNGKSQKENT